METRRILLRLDHVRFDLHRRANRPNNILDERHRFARRGLFEGYAVPNPRQTSTTPKSALPAFVLP